MIQLIHYGMINISEKQHNYLGIQFNSQSKMESMIGNIIIMPSSMSDLKINVFLYKM